MGLLQQRTLAESIVKRTIVENKDSFGDMYLRMCRLLYYARRLKSCGCSRHLNTSNALRSAYAVSAVVV